MVLGAALVMSRRLEASVLTALRNRSGTCEQVHDLGQHGSQEQVLNTSSRLVVLIRRRTGPCCAEEPADLSKVRLTNLVQDGD